MDDLVANGFGDLGECPLVMLLRIDGEAWEVIYFLCNILFIIINIFGGTPTHNWAERNGLFREDESRRKSEEEEPKKYMSFNWNQC